MEKNWKTKLIHSDAQAPEGFRSLATPVYRGSTTLFADVEKATDHWNQYEVGYTYGLYGTPTVLELAGRVCELENGFRTLITSSGQAAISLINFAFLKAGERGRRQRALVDGHDAQRKRLRFDRRPEPWRVGSSGRSGVALR